MDDLRGLRLDLLETEASIVLQRVPFDRPPALWSLYWRASGSGSGSVVPTGSGGLHIPARAGMSCETYFGAFFEPAWRQYTRLREIGLHLSIDGRAQVRIWRRLPGDAPILLQQVEVQGSTRIWPSTDVTHFRQAGLLWFDLKAIDGPVTLHEATWTTRQAEPGSVDGRARLAVVICTFDRQAPLADVLEAIAGDDGLETAVARVIVVNQGKAGLLAHPAIEGVAQRLGPKLCVIEQPNFGGAGGFGRGIVAAVDDPSCTHVCLLDDDVRLEPESLRRMAMFFSLAKSDASGGRGVALGGHMLDMLRPGTLYEAGAQIRTNWALDPLRHGIDLQRPEQLPRLLDTEAMHYNGWWMFGFDKAVVERLGMPLPCFIRGDDVEFGLRLHERGIPTVGLPGVAIWHEPFYVKIGGWQLYYETRNALITAALHLDFAPRHVAGQVVKRLLIHLLTFRYYNAALVIRAVQDFLTGPAILDRDPRPLHAALTTLRRRHAEETTPRERVLAPAHVGRSPRGRPAFMAVLAWAVALNWMRPTRPNATPRRLLARDLVWFRVMRAETLAVDTYWDRDLPTFRRDRAVFRALLSEGLRAAWELARAAPALRDAWHEAAPRLTSLPFWREYLARR